MSSAKVKESTLGDIHLHLTTKNSESHKNAILFRNFLINHPAEKQQYIDLKYQISKTVNKNRVEYTKGKKEFIESILNLAKKSP